MLSLEVRGATYRAGTRVMEMMGLTSGEDRMILALVILIRYQRMSGRQPNRLTGRRKDRIPVDLLVR